MSSLLVKGMIENALVVSAVESSEIVSEAIRLHGLSPVAAEALGRVLTAVCLMGKRLKNRDDYLTVTINGGGPLGAVTACADGLGNVKGYVNNPACGSLTKPDGRIDVGAAVGRDGKMTVIKDIGLKQPYIGASRLVSGEIAEDFANYFAVSEQQPTALTLGVALKNGKCRAAGGVLVEVLPDCPEELLGKVETTLYAMDEMSYQFENSSAKEVLQKFFGTYGITFTEESCVGYKCDCSSERIERVLRSIGKIEAGSILDEHGFIEVGCQFCGKKYIYKREDAERIFGV